MQAQKVRKGEMVRMSKTEVETERAAPLDQTRFAYVIYTFCIRRVRPSVCILLSTLVALQVKSLSYFAVMASGIGAQSRPSMRRKSSATTLLNSFKAGQNNPPPTAPATQLSMQIPSSSLGTTFGNHTGTSTPVTATQREWDSQSMKSDSVSSQAPLGQNVNGSPSLAQGTTLESLRDLVMKRMITLTYLRNVHEG